MKNKLFFAFKYTVLIFFASIIIFPIWMVVNSSFKDESELYIDIFGFAKNIDISNYIKAWVDGTLYIYYKNSVIVTLTAVIVIIILSSMVAFAITKVRPFLRSIIYLSFIAGITVPTQVAIIPLYIQLNKMGISNSLFGLIAAFVAYGLPFSVFIAYGFFKTIPSEIQESAIIDGCSNLKTYTKIIMPLSKPVIATVAIFNLVIIWNDMLFPLVIISSNSLKTLPIGLLKFRGEFISQYTVMFAGVVLVSLPLTIIYLLLQRQFMQGLTAGAIKG